MFQSQLNNIEYIDESHVYLIDGIIVSSVSELLKRKFPNKYKGIPKSVLNNKAQYGSIVHDSIQCYEEGNELPELNIHQKIALKQYMKLKDKYKFNVVNQEQIIAYKNIYCGRYDMTLIDADGQLCLGDIKTTSTLDKSYLSWQLSLYEMAYEDTFKTEQFPFKRFYCVYLPKNELGQFVEIERINREELEGFIYEQTNENA